MYTTKLCSPTAQQLYVAVLFVYHVVGGRPQTVKSRAPAYVGETCAISGVMMSSNSVCVFPTGHHNVVIGPSVY